jgi:hypothetical protein
MCQWLNFVKQTQAWELAITVGGMFCLCWRSLRSHGAVFANRGATRMFLFEYPTIAPLQKTIWEFQIFLFILRVIGATQKL